MIERDEYLKEIVELLQQDWKEGLSLFEEVLRNPGDLEARKKLRQLERKHRERKKPFLRMPFGRAHGDSILDCEFHLLHDPWDVECLYRLGELLRRERNVAKWIYEDIEGLVGEKADADDWERLAEGYESVEAWGRAAGIYRMLNTKRPRPEYERKIASAEAHARPSEGATGTYRDFIKDKEEAEKLEERGRLAKSAEDYLRKAHEKEEELPTAPTPQKRILILAEIARDYQRAGDAQRARENYDNILKIDADNPHALEALLLMDMAATEDRKKAAEIGIAGYEKLLALEPTNPEFSLELAKLHLEAEDYHKAILAFQKAGRHPNLKRKSRAGMASCFYRQGLYALAAREYDEALADTSTEEADRMEATYALADCHSQMGDLKRAFELFGEVYRRRADFKDVEKRVFELNEKIRPSSRSRDGS